MYASWGPPESITQTASRSVQPFWADYGRVSLYMYFTTDTSIGDGGKIVDGSPKASHH